MSQRCYAPLTRHPDEWCRKSSTWGLSYRDGEGSLSMMFCCSMHMNNAALEVERIKHPLSTVQLLPLTQENK